MRKLPVVCAAAFLTSSGWAATYTFTSGDYTGISDFTSCTTGPCMNYTTSMSASGSFTVPTPLGPNLNNSNIASQVTSYSFSDGINTYSNTNPNSLVYEFMVSTNANGNISSANILLEDWQSGTSPHIVNDRIAFLQINIAGIAVSNNGHCGNLVTAPSGVADACNVLDADTATSIAGVLGGTWMLAVPTPTLGEWETIFLGGLLVTFALLRLRRRERGRTAA